MSALIRRVKASTFLILNYSHWNTGTQLKRFENSSITSIRFKHKNSLLVSSVFTPVGDGSRGLYQDIKSNRSDPGNFKFVWFVAVSLNADSDHSLRVTKKYQRTIYLYIQFRGPKTRFFLLYCLKWCNFIILFTNTISVFDLTFWFTF